MIFVMKKRKENLDKRLDILETEMKKMNHNQFTNQSKDKTPWNENSSHKNESNTKWNDFQN